MTPSPSTTIGIPACIAPHQYHNDGHLTTTLIALIFPEISSGERRQARGQTAPFACAQTVDFWQGIFRCSKTSLYNLWHPF